MLLEDVPSSRHTFGPFKEKHKNKPKENQVEKKKAGHKYTPNTFSVHL
jgi:hypothetical protein